MNHHKRFLALAAATVTAALALTGCSASKSPESVAVDFIAAFMGDSGTLPSTFVCEGVPKSEADSNRRTTDLASNIRAGRTGEVNEDGYVVVEVLYTQNDNDRETDVQVNTRHLCVSAIDPSSGSPSENDPAPEPTEQPLGSYQNPFTPEDGSTLEFSDLAALDDEHPYLMLPKYGIVTIVGDDLEASSDSEVSYTVTDSGIELDAGRMSYGGYLLLSGNVNGEKREIEVMIDILL